MELRFGGLVILLDISTVFFARYHLKERHKIQVDYRN